jgi:hypothetical protein
MGRVRRRTWVWAALSALYVGVHLALVPVYLLDHESGLEDRVLGAVGVGAFPAVAFVAAAVPLLRDSKNGLAFAVGALLAVAAAFLQGMLTFGFALPLTLVLLALAAVDGNRAAKLLGIGNGGKVMLLAIALALITAPTISFELALVAGAVIVAIGIWKLAAPRVRRPTRAGS